MKKFKFKAIAIGTVVDIVCSLIVGTVHAGYIMATYMMDNGSMDDISEENMEQVMEAAMANMEQTVYAFNIHGISMLAYGAGFTVLGGYIAARIAKQYPYYNALGVAIAGIVLVTPVVLLLGSSGPLWYTALSFGVTIPAALLGGHLASGKKSKNDETSDEAL